MKRVAKANFLKIQHLVREGLEHQVSQFEARDRAEAERKKREAEEARKQPKRPRGRPPKLKLLEPEAPTEISDDEEVDTDNEDQTLYEKHGMLIAEVLHNPTEKRVRILEALKAVKDAFPLTHPSDGEIIAKLERCIVAAKKVEQPGPFTAAMAAPVAVYSPIANDTPAPTLGSIIGSQVARALDNMTGKTVDVSKIPSHGDMPINEETENGNA